MSMCDVGDLMSNDEHESARGHLAGDVEAALVELCRRWRRRARHPVTQEQIAEDRSDASATLELLAFALRSTKGEASQGGRDVEVFDDVGHADQILLQRPRHEDGVRTVWEGQERR